MQSVRVNNAQNGRVRFVFDDAVVSLSLARDATLEDIARALDELARRHHGKPVAIDVTLATASTPGAACPPPIRLQPAERPGLRWMRSEAGRAGRGLDHDGAARGRSILVVDDEPDVLGGAVGILEEAGFSVLAAACAMDAFCLLERHRDIALMFTDVVMPGLDGLMLSDMAVLRHRHLKIVYTTGYAEQVRGQPGYRYGPLLPKPYRSSDLVRVVELELAQAARPRYVLHQ